MLLALSLFIPYFLGLGLLSMLLCPSLVMDVRETEGARMRLFSIIFALGILVDYSLVLVVENLQTASYFGGGLAVAGLASAAVRLRGRLLRLFACRWLLVPFLVIVALYFLPIVATPIFGGDGRSIWFLHGKMIFYTGEFSKATGFSEEAVRFSQVDYPKLIGVLAAQSALVTRFWNEYVPKVGLLALLVPVTAAACSLAGARRFSALFLYLGFFFGFGVLLWNGYMDGYFALCAGVSLLFLARWIDAEELPDLLGGVVYLGLAASLKSEGLLFVLAVTAALTGAVFFLRRHRTLPAALWQIFPLCAISFLGFFLWSAKKSAWGLPSWFTPDASALSRLSERLSDGSFQVIGRYLLLEGLVLKSAIVAGVSLSMVKLLRERIPPGALFCLAAALLYFSGVFLVYLATPADLQWHLSTSATRTMTVVVCALFSASFLLLRKVEG